MQPDIVPTLREVATQVHQRPGVQLIPVFISLLALAVTVTLALLTPTFSPASAMWYSIFIFVEVSIILLSLFWYGVCRLLQQYFSKLVYEVHKSEATAAKRARESRGDDRVANVIAELREFKKNSDARDAHLEELIEQVTAALEHIREGVIEGIIPPERTRTTRPPVLHPANRPRN